MLIRRVRLVLLTLSASLLCALPAAAHVEPLTDLEPVGAALLRADRFAPLNHDMGAVACTPAPGRRFEVLYAYPADVPSRYAERLAAIRQAVRDASGYMDSEALETSPFHRVRLRVLCNADRSDVAVRSIKLATRSTGESHQSIHLALSKAGFGASYSNASAGDPHVEYLVYYEASCPSLAGCSGHAGPNLPADDQPGAANATNRGGGHALNFLTPSHGPRWSTTLHEAAHLMGAVKHSAPNASGSWHCSEGDDVMCYDDKGPTFVPGNLETCVDYEFDCNRDDYFNPAPRSGSYLDTHWNLASANNVFIAKTRVDVTAPTAPTALVEATSTDAGVTLEWTDSADAGPGELTYRVQRFDGTKWATLGSTRRSAATVIGPLTAAGSRVRIVAVDASANASMPSGVITLRRAPSRPSAPRVTSTEGLVTSLAWAASTDDSGPVTYELWRHGIRLGATSTPTVQVTIPAGVQRTYTVVALDPAGHRSIASAPVTAPGIAAAPAPARVQPGPVEPLPIATPDILAPTLLATTLPETTTTQHVTVNITAIDDRSVTMMRLANEDGNWGAWRPYEPAPTHQLTGGYGIRGVFVQVRDAAGNESGILYRMLLRYQAP